LGQRVLLKGYGSEGHDSAHPDYGNNYNTRAGGLEDLNTLIDTGHDWNARFGVHVNTTEAYPEAHSFGKIPIDEDSKGWNWLDQAYHINQREDLATSGAEGSEYGTLDRFRNLNEQVPGLDFLYIDVYYSYGWQAEHLAQGLQEMGLAIASEWSNKFQRYNTWSHWAADENYGGSGNKGINSQVFRFIANQRTDTWNPQPILGNAQIVEFEGWTGEKNWNAFTTNVWKQNLPNKFLQHFPITKWTNGRIAFGTADTPYESVTGRVTDDGTRQFTVGDAVVLNGNSYLLPWTFTGENKLYHFNADGGSTTWSVPAAFENASSATIYRLDQFGRHKVQTLDVSDGEISLDAEAGVPYVVYLDAGPSDEGAPEKPEMNYGQGTGIEDPGFNYGNLDAYEHSGDVSVQVTEDTGQINAVFGPGKGSIAQEVEIPEAGIYSAWAFVEVEPGKRRPVTLRVNGNAMGKPMQNTVERSTAKNWAASSEKNNTYFQRVRVVFEATKSGEVTLQIAAADGDATVRVDDVRMVSFTPAEDPAPTEETVFFNDFEHQDKGWFPFVKGDAG